MPLVGTFTLKVPDVLINGEKFSVRPISFERRKKWALFFFLGCA
jgi:hypothetical protein